MSVENYKNWKKTTALFFTSQMITLIGSALVQYAIIWHIAQTYQSGTIVMLATLCGFLPQIIIAVFAGVWADRISRKALIILSDAGIAIATLIAAIFFLNGPISLWLLLLISAIRSAGTGIQTPAVNAIIPDLVPGEKLLKVNGIYGSLQSMVSILPIALGGLLYAYFELYIIFFVDIVTAILGIVFLLFVKGKQAEKAEKRGYFTDLKAGIRYTFSNKFLRTFFVFIAIANFLIIPVAFLAPLQVTLSFGNDAWRLPVIELAFAGGAIITGLTVGVWQGFRSRTKTVAVTNMIQGALIALTGMIPLCLPMTETGFILYTAVMVVLGLTVPYMNAPSVTVLQETTDPQMLGRIFGFMQIATALALPAGMGLFGPLADVVAIEWLMLGSGLLLLMFGILYMTNKTVQNYKCYAFKPPAEEQPSISEDAVETNL